MATYSTLMKFLLLYEIQRRDMYLSFIIAYPIVNISHIGTVLSSGNNDLESTSFLKHAIFLIAKTVTVSRSIVQYHQAGLTE